MDQDAFQLDLTAAELEALHSLYCTADLGKIQEKCMPGVSSLMVKVYTYRADMVWLRR